MRFQSNRSSCGPAALSNALCALGVNRTEDELITLSGQRPAGTSAAGIVKAIRAVSGPDARLRGEPTKWRTADAAQIALWYLVAQLGRPVILCVDDFDHWVVCIGHLGDRFMVVDSADNRLVLSYSPAKLMERWEGPNGGWYGIIV